MKEAKLKIIIALMAVSLITLIAVQLYWISNAINIQEEKFGRDVQQALDLVVEKIDKSQTAKTVIKKIKESGGKGIVWIEDTVSDEREYALNDSILYTIKVDTEYEVKNQKGNVPADENKKDIIYNYVTHSSDTAGNIDFNSVVIKGKNKLVVKAKIDSLKKIKRKFVDDVVDEIIQVESSEPIHFETVDSLLNAELADKGIHTNFTFTIIKEPNANVYLLKESGKNIKTNSGDNSFSIRLNPQNVFTKPNYLEVNFPDKESYVLKSVTLMLSISAAVILLIIFLFYKTVRMLIKQKKITEIKNDLINNITHEFKTPISTISLAAEALNEPQLAKDKNSIDRYSKMILNENHRLGELVENLLNTASLQKGDYDLKKSLTDIHEMINELTEKIKSGNEKEIQIEKEFKADNFIILIDEFHISNSLLNLLDNAVKYSNDEVKIRILTENQKNNFIITICDNGIGIDKNQQKKIFDTFYRIPTGNVHDVKGNGIGLSYVKQMIEAHGGAVLVESRKGSGSIFKIILPIIENEKENITS